MVQNSNNSSKKGDTKASFSVNEDIVKKYVDLFDRLPIGIYRTTPEGRILTANPAFLALIGCDNFDDLMDLDLNKTHKNLEARKVFMREMDEKGEVYAKESVLVCSNGKEIIVEEYAKAHKNEMGEIIYYEGIVIDITGKRESIKRIEFLNGFKELILNLSTSFINVRLSDIDDQIAYSLKSIGSFIGADRSYLILFDDNEMHYMSNTHESVAEGIASVINELQEIPTENFPWWMDNLKKNKAILVPDVNDLPPEAMNEQKIFKSQDVKSLFAIPVFFEYRLIGFLGFDMVKQQKLVDNDTLELLSIAASLLANILNYQETEEKIIDNSKQLEKLVEERTQELENLNKQFKMLAESSNDVIWTMDMNLKTNYVSPSIHKQLGFTVKEYLAMPLEERLPPESFAKVREVFTRELAMLKNGEKNPDEHSVIFQILHKTKDGKSVWGEVSFNFLFDKEGNPAGIHGITRNVHERKLSDLALWESNERFKTLVENTSDWIWEVDKQGNYTYTSPMSNEITGYSPAELIGKSFADLLDPETKKDTFNYFKNMANAKKPFKNIENIILHKNGRKVYVETSGIPIFDISGAFIGYRGIDRDVTEKKNIASALRHSQLKLTQHLRNTPMGYIEWDNNLEVIEWNPAAQKIFGYNKTQAMVGNMIAELIPFDEQDEVMKLFPETLVTGKPVRKTHSCITREGKKILCEWFITPIYDDSGNTTGLSTLVREVTRQA